MSKRFANMSRFLSGEAAAPEVEPAPVAPAANANEAPKAANIVTDEQLEAALDSALSAGTTEGHSAGFKAATDRFAAVMNSEPGKANPAAAVHLLTDAHFAAVPADALIATIGKVGAPSAAAPAAPAPAGQAGVDPKAIEAATPAVKVGQPKGQSPTEAGADSSAKTGMDAVLDSVIPKVQGQVKHLGAVS